MTESRSSEVDSLEPTRPWTGLGFAGVGLALIAACSTAESHGPVAGDCVDMPGQAKCSEVAVGGGGTSAQDGGADASQCVINSSQTQCDQCAYESCCDAISSCFSVATCSNLYNCTQGCGGVSSCVASCEALYADAVIDLRSIESCMTVACPVCNEFGVGDPCGGGSTCLSGLECGNLWCTKPCRANSDCTGLGANGGNLPTGLPNACVEMSVGPYCAPECNIDADCAAFVGTFCEATASVEGESISICALLPDGG
jgi:hypothetical protein